MLRRQLAAALAVLVLAGCASPAGAPPSEDDTLAFTPCEHPWPCADGSEWPPGLEGPFAVLAPEHIALTAHDGTTIAGDVWRPDVPEAVRVPTIVFASPYFSTTSFATDDPDPEPSTSFEGRFHGGLFENFTSRGYAVLMMSVRGTGESGGCFGWGGLDEQLDQVATVEWAAKQPWSNGRIGYWGISYHGTTSWEAAIHAPEALKAIWAGGIITDWYLNGYSPQGLSGNGYAEFSLGRFVEQGVLPPIPSVNVPTDRSAQALATAAERACPGTPDAFLRHAGTMYVDDRKPGWFAERRYVSSFANVTAAVMLTHGLQDNAAHRVQEDIIWSALPNAPKWFLQGQWEHTISFDDQLATYPHGKDDWDLTIAWFDFWLKGIGPIPRIGRADFQTTAGDWRETSAWPPPEAREEALFLAGGLLAPGSGTSGASFTAAPASTSTRLHALTPGVDDGTGCHAPTTGGTMLAFVSDPLPAATIAGNPYALLEIESDRPGGGFRVDLLAFKGDSLCDAGEGVEYVSAGGVDLRFHDGTLVGHDFPTGTRVPVRVDLWNVAQTIREGQKLALVLRSPNEETKPWSPTITVHGASHLVLPIVDGTLGGGAPPVAPPPRPFAG